MSNVIQIPGLNRKRRLKLKGDHVAECLVSERYLVMEPTKGKGPGGLPVYSFFIRTTGGSGGKTKTLCHLYITERELDEMVRSAKSAKRTLDDKRD